MSDERGTVEWLGHRAHGDATEETEMLASDDRGAVLCAFLFASVLSVARYPKVTGKA